MIQEHTEQEHGISFPAVATPEMFFEDTCTIDTPLTGVWSNAVPYMPTAIHSSTCIPGSGRAAPQGQLATFSGQPPLIYLVPYALRVLCINQYNVAHLIELPFVRKAVDQLAGLVGALADNLSSCRDVRDPVCSLVVGDDRVGEAPLPPLKSEEGLSEGKAG